MQPDLKTFLDSHQIPYEVIQHPLTFTALDTAAVTHVDGKELAKTVIVRIDGVLAMAVVPATHWADLEKLRDITGAELVNVAYEREFEQRFPDCEPGAMPPFGNLYGMPVYVASELALDQRIYFNDGSHREVVGMSYADFYRLVEPIVDDISNPRQAIRT